MSSMYGNQTMIVMFYILGFPDLAAIRILLFLLFLNIYLIAVSSNLLMIIVTKVDSSLQNPMYFFLGNLSAIDICYISVTVPHMLIYLVSTDKSISFCLCITQLFSVILMEGTECILLAIMAYDRYVAICKPLEYILIMNRSLCYRLLVVAVLWGTANSLIHTLLIAHLPFCDSGINHVFCDIPPLLKLSCTDTFINETVLFAIGGVFVGLGPLLFILVSYVQVIFTIFQMASKVGRQKIFSTCTSHLTVVMIFYGTGCFNYVRPKSSYSMERDKSVSVIYNVVTPMLNPIIYSLRNSEVKRTLKNLFQMT